MSIHSSLSRDPTRPGPALWFGLLGGAAAWAVQFLAGYLITEGVCVGATGVGGVAAGAGARISGGIVAVVVVSVLTFAVAVGAALAGRRVWLRQRTATQAAAKAHRRDASAGRADVAPEGGTGWAGLAGMLLSGTFAFIILAQVLPLFMAGGCA